MSNIRRILTGENPFWRIVLMLVISLLILVIVIKQKRNRKNNQKNIGIIKSSNLCIEINEVSNKDETAVCNLASICASIACFLVVCSFSRVNQYAPVPCPLKEGLEKLKEDAKLSDITKTVTMNYTTYYECAVKTDAWIEWYTEQKTIYESK